MGVNRYARAPILGGGTFYGTSLTINIVKQAADAGLIRTKIMTSHEGDRLDIIAGREYGDSSNWWVIAAASGIGWALQMPPGTRLVVPVDLSEVMDLVA